MEYTVFAKPGAMPQSPADVIRCDLLNADKAAVAEWLENLPDESFLSVFTAENRILLARLLRGEIKKKKGIKQERGFADFLLFFHYKKLREQGFNRANAIKNTAEAVRNAGLLPENDLFRQAVGGRYWKDENVEENIKEIISKLENFFSIKLTP